MRLLFRILLAAVLAVPALTTAVSAQGTADPAQGIPARVAGPTLRTPAEMEAFDAAHPVAPTAGILTPFLPTMDVRDYLAAKAAAAAAPADARPIERPAAPPSGPPVQGAASCNGLGQLAPVTSGFFPPDTHGAVGATQFAQIVNSAFRVYSKALSGNCPTSIQLNVTLNAFFGYAPQFLFDPRVVYDMNFSRWIVSAEGFPEGTSLPQFHFVAVSLTSDAAGAYFIYAFDMRALLGATIFWDFPQLGYDEEAIIFTGNVFNPGYVNSMVFFLPKARMYAGLGFSFCFFFLGTQGTVAPPIVLDQGPHTTLATARTGTNTIRLTKFTGTARACPTFVEQADIASIFSVPSAAPQPGVCPAAVPSCSLDTSDARFVNASTQFGEPVFGQTVRLWNTHTIDFSGFPTPLYYQFNANLGGAPANTIEDSCFYFTSATSSDFNASLAANGNGDVFITWSATDTGNGVSPQVRFTGKKFADACSTLGAPGGITNNTSANPLTGNFDANFGLQRWGDYSAVSIDPSLPSRAWAVNEKVQTLLPGQSLSTWKTRFFDMDNP